MDDNKREYRKSSYSNVPNQSCVEVSVAEDETGIGDTKHPGGPKIHVSRAAWLNFMDNMKNAKPTN